MTLEPRNEATDGTSVRYFTRSSIPGNRVGRRWNFDENIYYNEPEWLPEDDEQPDDFEIKDVYDYPLHKTHKNIEKRAPVKKSLVPLINITRCAYITHVPGIQETDLEYLNKWYQKYWRAINSSEFNYINLSDYIKNDILYNYKDPVKVFDSLCRFKCILGHRRFYIILVLLVTELNMEEVNLCLKAQILDTFFH